MTTDKRNTTSQPLTQRLLNSRKHAAELLDFSVRTLDDYIADGTIKVHRSGTRILIRTSELERFASENHLAPVRPWKTAGPKKAKPK
jgi:excisionase family DNA binding protein